MHEYRDDDPSTPESLLQETVAFARTLLDDLQKANIIVGNRWNPHICTVGLACIADPADDAFHKKYNPHESIVRRESYATSHPAVIDSVFDRLIGKLMEKAGFRDVRHDPRRKGHADFREDEFSIGGTRGVLYISNISVSCVTLPGKLRRALTVDDAELEKLCLRSLQQSFAGMARIKNRAEIERVAKIARKNIKPGFDPKQN